MRYKTGEFKGYDGTRLFYRSWLPEGEIKAVILMIHGIAEHSGRYEQLARGFANAGYGFYCHDLRGHGKSAGKRCNIKRFSEFINDLNLFLELVKKEQKGKIVFLMGHSMGGTIAATFASTNQDNLAGLVLSGTSTNMNVAVSPLLVACSKIMSTLFPNMGTKRIDASAISRDQKIVEAYVHDPLVFREKIRARIGTELLQTMRRLPSQVPAINKPILLMHGTADRLSDPGGCRILFERLGSTDKTLKLYEGFYHEVFNEPGCEVVLKNILDWLEAHLTKRKN